MNKIIFDAQCMKCKKRKGIELPDSPRAQLAIASCKVANNFGSCSCGGYVDIQVYPGTLDEKRNVKEA